MIKRLRTCLTAGLIALAMPLGAGAQATTAPVNGKIVGVVVDSLRGAYLSGADIAVEGVGGITTPSPSQTDTLGRFKIESLAPGAYRVAVFHPRLDTLGIALITQSFRVGADSTSVVVLGVPSARTLIRRSCGDRAGPYGESAVTGHVTDPETLQPIAHAEVSIAWDEIEISKEGGWHRAPHLMLDSTDAAGGFKICGLPNSLEATLQARRGSAITGEIPISLGDKPFELLARTLLLSPAAAGTNSGNATLSGTVLLEASRTNADTRVELTGTNFVATTNEKGEFVMRNLPSGTMLLLARHLGFVVQAVAVDLSSRKELRVAIKLPKFVEMMAPVLVTARRDAALDKVGFNRRRKAGFGFFIGPEQLKDLHPQYVSEILRRAPGLRVNYGPYGETVSTARGVANGCMQYFMDEAPYTELRPGDVNQYVTARDVVAVEVYQGPETPPEYVRSGLTCTTIVLWTRFKIRG